MKGVKPKELYVPCPWGKVAVVTWGSPENPPVLLLHGYLDSAATFIPLVQHLSNDFFYVAIDLPGHGKSDHFPKGVLLSLVHFVESVRYTVKYLNWNHFTFLGHSMAVMIGLFYNASYPGEISKMILLDPVPPLSFYSVSINPTILAAWIEDYYSNYDRYNNSLSRVYSYEQIINAVVRRRNLSEEQAEVIMTRSIIPVGEGKFKMSMDQRIKKMANVAMTRDFLEALLTQPPMPKLMISASDSTDTAIRKWAMKLLEDIQNKSDNFLMIYAKGGHDFHITDAELVAPQIEQFLKRDFKRCVRKSKL